MSFADVRQQELPEWLADEVGLAFERVRGEAQDTAIALLKGGVMARMLEFAPDDALDFIGGNFDEARFLDESHDHYRERLADAWEWKAMLGTNPGIETALRSFLECLWPLPSDVAVEEDWEFHGATGDWYSRFWAVIGPESPWQALQMPFALGTPTLGSTATKDEIREVKRQILKRKSPHGYPVGVLVKFEDTAQLGPGLAMPFAMGQRTCFWRIGKLFGDAMNMPFQMGGWQET